MKHIIITLVVVLLAGCAKNNVTILNSGTNEWSQIQLNGGGQQFKIDGLKGGDSKSFSFKSKKEDGGVITGNLDGKLIKSEIGYFTPNIGNKIKIILDDHGGIEIKNLPVK